MLGRELVISKDGREEVRARYYLSGARFYILTAKGMGFSSAIDPTDVDPSIESGTDNDAGVRHFLISFHLTPAANS